MKARRIMITTDAVGGVWVYATSLAQRLAEAGCGVTLVTLGPSPNGERTRGLHDRCRDIEVLTTSLELEWQDPEGRDVPRARSELLRIADRVRPDLVHLNSFREGAIPWSCPSLVVAHSCVLSWWQATRHRWPDESRWRDYGEAVRAGLNAASAWAAPSASFRRCIEDIYQPETFGWVIPNGAKFSHRSPSGKSPLILASGRVWDGGKNLMSLAEIADALPWPVHIAGAGMPAVSANDVGNVHWLGEIGHDDLQEWMRRSTIYAAPALYEPFGLGILEAAFAGCALVLSDIPSLRELWDGAARFVSPGDTAQLRDILVRLCDDPGLRLPLQRAAAARARRYSLDRMVAAYLELYGHLLNPARQGRPRAASHPELHA